MTRGEAINNLKRVGECLDMTYANEQEKEELEAINIAIQALKEQAIPLSVIDKIKAEINTKIQMHSSPKDDVFFCLDYAYRVIDEKIKEYTE